MIPMNPFTAAVDDIDTVSRGWWALLVTGLISVVAGGVILSVDWKVGSLATFIGALLVARGFFTMFNVPIDGSGRAWAIGSGLLEIALGLMVWAWPSPTLLVIAFWIGWYVLFSGILTIAGATTARTSSPTGASRSRSASSRSSSRSGCSPVPASRSSRWYSRSAFGASSPAQSRSCSGSTSSASATGRTGWTVVFTN